MLTIAIPWKPVKDLAFLSVLPFNPFVDSINIQILVSCYICISNRSSEEKIRRLQNITSFYPGDQFIILTILIYKTFATVRRNLIPITGGA